MANEALKVRWTGGGRANTVADVQSIPGLKLRIAKHL
jgi:hypothetical protein